MAKFADAIAYVLSHEGGTSNNTADPGGLTKYGISVKQYPDVANATFSPYDAERIYARDYWKYDDITDQRVATKIFDMAVNMGPGQAHKQVQVVLSMALIDGVLGPATVEQINSTDPQKLLDDLCVRSAVFYALLAVVKPVRAAFIPGWVRRAFDQPKI